jgi:hypothetical protein
MLMKELAKARLTIGLLAFFATVWIIYQKMSTITNQPLLAFGFVLLLFGVQILLSVILLGILEWIRIFDLKINAVITLIVLITVGISTAI